MVTVAEILKSKQLAVVTKLYTSLEHATADERCFDPLQALPMTSGYIHGYHSNSDTVLCTSMSVL